MKRQLMFLFLALGVFLCHAEGVATWLNTSHDFGTFREEVGKVSCDIKLVNTGDSALRITNVRPTCGCTASDYTMGSIQPGDTALVTLTYNPKGRPGRFNKDVYVYTDGIPKKSVIAIKGNVIGSPATIQEKYPVSVGALKLERRIIPFGEIKKGKSRTLFINAYNQSDDTLKTVFLDVPKHLMVETVPDSVLPGDLATITITYRSQECDDWGLVQDCFTMETLPVSGKSNNAVAGIGTIETTAILKENFGNLSQKELGEAPVAKLSTDKLLFDNIGTEENAVTSKFEIANTGKRELLIRKIVCADKGINVSLKKNKIKSGKSQTVTVMVNPAEIKGDILNTKLSVITNDPANPEQTIRLVGRIVNNK